jgi:hypothetical protein
MNSPILYRVPVVSETFTGTLLGSLGQSEKFQVNRRKSIRPCLETWMTMFPCSDQAENITIVFFRCVLPPIKISGQSEKVYCLNLEEALSAPISPLSKV